MGNTRRFGCRALAAGALAAALTAVQSAPASAADRPVAIAGFQYVSPVVVALAGDTVSVTNLDGAASIPHNIVSRDRDATGAPLFRSPLTNTTTAQDVAGVSSTPPGVYQFTCNAHGFMNGVLVVV